jgi:hypothetical protein
MPDIEIPPATIASLTISNEIIKNLTKSIADANAQIDILLESSVQGGAAADDRATRAMDAARRQ